MPQERENPFPFPTAEEVEAAPGDRATKSARNVIVRHIPGIPRRGYLLGDCDHAPVYKGVRDLTEAAWALLDTLDSEPSDIAHNTAILERVESLRAILTDHGCSPAGEPK